MRIRTKQGILLGLTLVACTSSEPGVIYDVTRVDGSHPDVPQQGDAPGETGSSDADESDVRGNHACKNDADCAALLDVGPCERAVCDGGQCVVENEPAASTPCELQAGVCQGALKPAALCLGGEWLPCDSEAYLAHAAAWEATEGTCDNLDNDCDGVADAADPDVTDACCTGPADCPNPGDVCADYRCEPGADGACDGPGDCPEIEYCDLDAGVCVGYAIEGDPCDTAAECGAGLTCGASGLCEPLFWCGDGTCQSDLGESCLSCKKDCACESGVCFNGACCEPDCEGRDCGPDACGGTCAPGCGEGELCSDEGSCLALTSCGDGECDPTLSESCLTCATDCACESGVCFNGACCTPDCAGRECGSDSCGGTCAPGCGGAEVCSDEGQCLPLTTCGDGVCDPDLDETCLTCKKDCACESGVCFNGTCCAPDCADRECGPDACGGTCAPGCSEGELCSDEGSCLVLTTCGDGVCDPALSESCLTCAQDCTCEDGETCFNGACCVSDCDGRECGSDACGGTCAPGCGEGELCSDAGLCVSLTTCGDGLCDPDLDETCLTCQSDCGCAGAAVCAGGTCCEPQCEGRECGSDACGGTCAPGCEEGEVCSGAGTCLALDTCGDGVCDPAESESCLTCLKDCACGPQLVCFNGACCTPSCDGSDCGSDGCGGECQPGCIQGEYCGPGGHCTAISACGDGVCDSTAEETCATCKKDCACSPLGGETCFNNACCAPDCEGRTCGPDGCGGQCGPGCVEGQFCDTSGQCESLTTCGDGQCDASAEESCFTCVKDCGCAQGTTCHQGLCCTPQCEGRECGSDLCGGECGQCEDGNFCGSGGQCLPVTTCGDGVCDPSAEESCLTCKKDCACEEDAVCTDGECCVPACEGKTCGSDGCGGTCGAGCGEGTTCGPAGTCIPLSTCGSGGCQSELGETCISCAPDCGCGDGDTCTTAGLCCTPDCSGRECGPDGCGGSCGGCDEGTTCSGQGQCVPLSTCGVGGCQVALGESCLTCPADCACEGSAVCFNGQCATADCAGKQCGPDGIGGTCGQCGDSEFCSTAGKCVCLGATCGSACCLPSQVCGTDGGCCTPSCAGKSCGDDGCGGTCGTCPLGYACNSDGQCGPEFGCGDGICGDDEGCLTCPVDCACGSGQLCFSGGANGKGECQCLGPACGEGCCLPSEVCHQGGCCKPQCTNKQCGSDGCGGVCGQCFGNEICKQFANGAQACCDDSCPPGWECGVNACGRSCGTCADGSACNATTHKCEEIQTCGTVGHAACEPEAPWFETCETCSDCACASDQLCDPGQDPGGDGCVACDAEHDGVLCGGECCSGRASEGFACNGAACCKSDCVVYGGTRECGTDACGGTCGVCDGAEGIACIAGSCQCPFETCQNDTGGTVCCDAPSQKCHQFGKHPFPVCYEPQCTGPGGAYQCGLDANGYPCGTCSSGSCLRYSDDDTYQACSLSSGAGCEMDGAWRSECCVPSCDGKACGPNGCGGTCGTCSGGQVCNEESGTCCLPECNPADECGDDGCGGTCGDGCSGETFCVLDPDAASYRVCKPKSCDEPLQCVLDGADGSCLACPDPLTVCTDHGPADSCDDLFSDLAWPTWLGGAQNQGLPETAPPNPKWRLDDRIRGRSPVMDDKHLFTVDDRYVRIWDLYEGPPYAGQNSDRQIQLQSSSESWYGSLVVRSGADKLLVVSQCSKVNAYTICEGGGNTWLGGSGPCPETLPGSYHNPTPVWSTSFDASGTCYNRPVVGYTHDTDGSNYQQAIFHVAGDHKLYALSLTDGQVVWNVTMGGSGTVYSSPAITPDGNVVAASATGVLYSIRPDGKTRWSAKVGSAMRSDPLVLVTQTEPSVRYRIYAAPDGAPTYQQRVLCFGQDGGRLWTSQLAAGRMSNRPALRLNASGQVVVLDGTYYGSDGFSSMTFLNPETGAIESATMAPHAGGMTALTDPGPVSMWLARCSGCQYGGMVFHGPDHQYVTDIVPAYSNQIGGLSSLSRPEDLMYSPDFPDVLHVSNTGTTYRLVRQSCADLGYTECGTDGAGNSCGECAGDTVCLHGRCLTPVTDEDAACGYDGAGGPIGDGCTGGAATCAPDRTCQTRMDPAAIYPVEGGDRFHTWNVPTLSAPPSSVPGEYEEFTFHGQAHLSTGIAQDTFGHLYVGATNNWFYKLITTGGGGLEWEWIFKEAAGYFLGTPYVADDGTIFAGNQDRNVYAMGLNAQSQIVTRWKYGVPDAVQGSPVPASLIDPNDPTATPVDGILVVAGEVLYALDAYTSDPAGTLLWQVQPLTEYSALMTWSSGGGRGQTLGTPSTGADGTIYFTAGEWIIALHPDGRLKWKFAPGGILASAPIIDVQSDRMFVVPSGRIRYGSPPEYNHVENRQQEQSVLAVDLTRAPGDPDFLLWKYHYNPTAYPNVYSYEGALSPDGLHLYVLTDLRTSGQESYVVSLNASTGKEEWRVKTTVYLYELASSSRHMFVTGTGSILVGGTSRYEWQTPYVVSFSPSGTQQWKRRYCNTNDCTVSGGDWALGRTGGLIFPARSQAINGSFAIRRQ